MDLICGAHISGPLIFSPSFLSPPPSPLLLLTEAEGSHVMSTSSSNQLATWTHLMETIEIWTFYVIISRFVDLNVHFESLGTGVTLQAKFEVGRAFYCCFKEAVEAGRRLPEIVVVHTKRERCQPMTRACSAGKTIWTLGGFVFARIRKIIIVRECNFTSE